MNGGEVSVRKIKRSFKTTHVKLVLEVDLDEELIEGYAELTIVPHSRKLFETGELKLNCRQLIVTQVLVNQVVALYEQRNYLHQIVPDSEPKISVDVYNDFYRAALYASDEGELLIYIPDVILKKQQLNRDEHLVVRVEYHLRHPLGGIHFIQPHPKAYPDRAPHVYTDNQPNSARMWFPCVDNLTEHSTFEMEFTVDPHLVVVSSGDLVDQFINEDQTKKTYCYRMNMPTAAHTISLAIAPFEILADPNRPSVTHFCLPGRYKELAHTTSFLSKAFSFYEEFLGFPFPLKSYKQVFVEETSELMSSGATVTTFSTHILHDDTIIDQTYETRRLMALGLALQWFGNFISVRSSPDSWIYYGLAGYMSNLFYRYMFGVNAYRFRIQKESEWVCVHDVNQPLYFNGYLHPSDITQSELFQRKAPLVMYMIERRVGAEAFRKVLSNVVSPTAEGEQLDRNISTKKFLKMLRRLTGHDLRPFADRWVYSKGCPDLACGFWFNRKKHVIEFALKQNKSAAGRVSGSLVIRAHELEGPHDHVVNFDDDLHSFEFQAHSRVRKSRKKKKGAPEEKQEEEELDSSKKNETPVSWIRVDPDIDFLHTISFRLPEYMWIFQLEEDPDIVAQYEAAKGLGEHVHSFKALDALNRLLCDDQMFFEIRLECARSMARSATTGLDMLFKFFKREFYDAEGTQIRPNDFSNFEGYFMQKGTAEVIAGAKDNSGRTSPDVLEFLLDLLKNNDNSRNFYSDNYYLATILRALTRTNTSGLADHQKIHKQVERYLSMEKLMPSYRNTITIACLQSLTDMQAVNKVQLNLDLFKEYTAYGHYEEVRITAVESLIRLGLHKGDTLEFLLDLLTKEKIPLIRAKIAELLAVAPLGTDEAKHFRPFTVDSPANLNMIKQLWISLNSIDTAYDSRTRASVLNLFQKIWGNGVPRILAANRDKLSKIIPKTGVEQSPISPKIPALKISIPKQVRPEEPRPNQGQRPPVKLATKPISQPPPPTRPTVPSRPGAPPQQKISPPKGSAPSQPLRISVPRPPDPSRNQQRPAESHQPEQQRIPLKLSVPKVKPAERVAPPPEPHQRPPEEPRQHKPPPKVEPPSSQKRDYSDMVSQDPNNSLMFKINLKKPKADTPEVTKPESAKPEVPPAKMEAVPTTMELEQKSPTIGKPGKKVRIKLTDTNSSSELNLLTRDL